MIVWISLQFPRVQTFIIGKVTSNLSAKLKVPVRIKRVNIHFFKTIVLEGVYIEDQQKDTLLYAGALKANVGLLSLSKKTINIDYVGLENARINIYRNKGEEDYNYAFIQKAFASADTTAKDTTSDGWEFDMSQVELQKINLTFYDYNLKSDLKLALNKLNVEINTLGLKDQHMKVDEIMIDHLGLKYNIISSTSTADTLVVAAKQNVEQSKNASDVNVFKLSINDIELKESALVFNNLNFAPQIKGIDFNHLALSGFNAKLKDLSMAGADFAGEVKEFKLKEKSGFILNNLAVEGSMVDAKLHVELNEFNTPNSSISDKITVDIANLNNVQKEIGNIAANADFDDAVLSMKDVFFFSPSLDSIQALKNMSITVNGSLKGKMSDLQFTDAGIALNKQNYIKGDFVLKGLPDMDKMSFDVKVNDLSANGSYISSILPKNSMPVNVAALGNIKIKFMARGDMHRFISNSKINTSVGSAGYNLKVELDKNMFPQAVVGQITTDKFNIGKLLSQPQIGPLTFAAKLETKGKEVIDLESVVKSFTYNKYNYQNVNIEGTYTNKVANAEISCLDSNLNILLDGYFDFKKSPFLYDFTAHLKNVNLHKLNLYATPLVLHTNLDVHAQGSDIDSLRANLLVSDFMIMNEKVEYTLDTLKGSADYIAGFKTIKITSPVLNGDVQGRFSYAELPLAMQQVMSHYMAAFKPTVKPANFDSLQFNIKIGDTKGITRIFAPSIKALRDIELNGSFIESTHDLQFNAKVGHLVINDQRVKNIELGVTGDKDKLNIDFKSNTVSLGSQMQLFNPTFKGIFSHDSLQFNVSMKDSNSTSSLNLDGGLTMRGDSFKLKIPDADIALRGNKWDLSKEALLVYAPKYLMIRNFELNSGNQQIAVNTSAENTNKSILHANLREVKLGDITNLLGLNYSIEGQIDGTTEITDMMGGLGIISNMKITSLQADRKEIGNLTFSAKKRENGGVITLKTDLTGAGNQVDITGNYDMNKTEDNMDFKINVENLNTNSVQPFVKDMFYILNGKLQANLSLTGSAGAPLVTGKIFFRDTHNIGITAIQTNYRIVNQEIVLNPGSIQLNNFVIYDTSNQAARVNGFVYHEKMKNFSTALTFNADNFQFIDSDNSNAPVFGKFIADVNVKVNGPIDNLDVNLNILTKAKTNLSLNLVTQQVLTGRPKYIKFMAFHHDTSGFNRIFLDSSAVSRMPQVDMSRFKISGFINVTKEATFNIIINPSTGDKIVASGDGKFRMNFDSNNDINLFGQFDIDHGSYGLSFLGLVKREFKIDKGSTINFYGNPQEGEMNIAAIYRTKTSRYDLISDMDPDPTTKNASKLKQPVDLYMKLKGEFLKPEISFDIIVPESKNSLSLVAQRIQQIENNESELNKQVFGLLVMGKFFPYAGGASSSSGGGMNETASETVGSLIADQLNKLSDEFISGVSIQVNTEAQTDINNNVSNNVSVMATKQVSDRLSVGVGGKSNISNTGASQGVAGEYNIEYKINKEGTVSIKLFSTSQQNIYTNSNNQVSGFSLNHSKSFDKIKEIFR